MIEPQSVLIARIEFKFEVLRIELLKFEVLAGLQIWLCNKNNRTGVFGSVWYMDLVALLAEMCFMKNRNDYHKTDSPVDFFMYYIVFFVVDCHAICSEQLI